MPTPTYTPLANLTLGATSSSITFSSIPATYQDLEIVLQGSSTDNTDALLRLNGDTGTTYRYQRFGGNGTAYSSVAGSSQTSARMTDLSAFSSTTTGQLNISILDYSATDKVKTIISKGDNAGVATEGFINRWTGTAAVTSVTILVSTATTFTVGTTATLYGIVD